jgi:hypothetical protein
MTTSSPILLLSPMNAQPHFAFRLALLLFAAVLGMQCVWLLLPQLLGTGPDRLPTDPASAAVAAQQRRAAARSASIGIIRGDLWAASAFTYADLLWDGVDSKVGPTQAMQHARANLDALQRARASLDRAVSDAPQQSGAWLLLAALASRYPSLDSDVPEALKMSYYTGPSEQDLMPLRLRIAARSNVFADSEIRELVARDLRFFLARNEKSTIVDAYHAASPAGKQFIEQTVRDFDPSAVESLGVGAQTQTH